MLVVLCAIRINPTQNAYWVEAPILAEADSGDAIAAAMTRVLINPRRRHEESHGGAQTNTPMS
jgi:hypothetical protein